MFIGVVIFAALNGHTFANDTDNAALLYYQACLMYQPDESERGMVSDCATDRTELNQAVEEFVEKQQQVIKMVVTAAEVPKCDWGLDFSNWIDTPMPHLSDMRKLSKLIIAEANVLAGRNDYQSALARCVTSYKMARHVSDRTLISHLVGVAITAITDKCVKGILSEMPQDLKTLDWLKDELARIEDRPFSYKSCLLFELDLISGLIKKETFGKQPKLEDWIEGQVIAERIMGADEVFYARNRKYCDNYVAKVKAALDLAYPANYTRLKDLGEETTTDAQKNPDATLTALFVPATSKVAITDIRNKASFNAIRAAVDIYTAKAKAGKLPAVLPAGLPKDPFSGKDFEYEKTADGFILRCQGKDLRKDETYEYEFKVVK
jgi:hypothetical protein